MNTFRATAAAIVLVPAAIYAVSPAPLWGLALVIPASLLAAVAYGALDIYRTDAPPS